MFCRSKAERYNLVTMAEPRRFDLSSPILPLERLAKRILFWSITKPKSTELLVWPTMLRSGAEVRSWPILFWTGAIISFRVGNYDAKELAEEMKPVFTGEDLEHLENHHISLRLFIDGKMSRAFSAMTLPPIPKDGNEAERDMILRVSRERFTVPRDIIEEKISKWFSK